MAAKGAVKRVTRPARKAKLGQNFLRDQSAIRKIVDALGNVKDRLVIEIGPGEGVITRAVAERGPKCVVAIELDRILAAKLRLELAQRKNIEIIEANVLQVDFGGIVQGHLRGIIDRNPGAEIRRAKLVGNLPYYITSDILLKLFDQHQHFSELVIMVQREVAERLAAKPGTRDYGLLTATAQLYCDIQNLFTLPPGAFAPPPKVHSTVLRLGVNPKAEQIGICGREREFIDFLKLAFGQKRKTLANNLKTTYGATDEILSENRLRPDARAEALSIKELAQVFLALNR
jgi:16S rRNA (adenine1518-N6/adenine1519-N6)-dimethyltransferase